MGLFLVIMGVQGAGKGTQATFIAEEYHIPHISTGELFRAMKTRSDELAQRVQAILRAGLLVPDDITNAVLLDRLQQPDAGAGAILDGYPRNIAQAEWLGDHLAQQGEKLAAVLSLDLDPYTAFKRAFGRVSAASGEQYNIYTNNEGLEWRMVDHPQKEYPARLEVKLQRTGELLQRRSDDEAVPVIKRIDTYLQETAPLLDYYRGKGLLVQIPADQLIAAVSRDLKRVIDAIR